MILRGLGVYKTKESNQSLNHQEKKASELESNQLVNRQEKKYLVN